MTGIPRLLSASLVAMLVLPRFPVPAVAAEGGIPAEPATTLLPGATASAVAIETDGAPVLVRIVEGADGRLEAEAWVEDGEAWVRRGEPARLEGEADRVRLLAAHIDGQPTALAVTSAARAFACCTRVVAVSVADAGATADPIAELDLAIDAAIAVDLDGDGNDELALRQVAIAAAEIAPTIHVARITGGVLEEVGRVPLRSRLWETPFLLGETDGLPGEEIGLIDHAGPGHLGRLTWRPETGASLETGRLFAPRLPRQDVTGVRALPDGSLLVLNTGSSNLARWPSGTEPQLTASGADGGVVLGVLRDQGAIRIVALDPLTSAVRVFDERLRRLERVPAPGNPFGSAWLPQYTGPLPVANGGSAVVAYGTTYRLEGGELRMEPAATLGATHPIAALGTDGQWLALLRTLDGRLMSASGGQLRGRDDWANDRLSVAPASVTLAKQADLAPRAWLTMEGAIAGEGASRDPGSIVLTVSADGYRLGVHAPPGSRLHARGIPGGAEVVELGDEPHWLVLDIHPTSSDPFLLAVVTPSGRSYTSRLTVDRVLKAAPPLEVAASTPLFGATAMVEGRTMQGAMVAVDGEAASVDADGHFEVEVAAGLVPRTLAIEAIDPLGGRSSAELVVVGLVDYLSVPWAALLAIGVLAAVAVRAWRRPPGGPVRSAAGSVQEIGADPPAELAVILRPLAATPQLDHAPMPDPRDEPIPDDEAPDPDVLPPDAPRGAQAIPNPNQSGITTPPISGWGETLTGEERVSDGSEEEGRP